MKLSFAQYISWFGAMALAGGLVWALAKRRLLTSFPVFSAYVAFYLLRDILDLFVWHIWPRTYYKFFWAGHALGFAIEYLLIFDFWKKGLRSYPGIWRLGRGVLGFACLGLLAVVRATTEYGQGAGPHAGQWINDWMRLVERSVLFTQATFLLAFFVVLGFFRIPISSLLRGLALCWFSYCLVRVPLYSLRYFFGAAVQGLYSWALPMSYLVLLAAWLVVVWTCPAEEEVEVAPVWAFGAGQRQAVLARMELLNSSLLRMWKG